MLPHICSPSKCAAKLPPSNGLYDDSSTQRALHHARIPPVRHSLGPIPQRNTTKVGQPLNHGALDRRRHRIRSQIARPRTYRASRSTDEKFRFAALGCKILGPGAEGVGETGAANVAPWVVVELDKDKVHGEHGVKRDGGIGADTLGSAGDEVLFGAVGVHGGAEGVDEGGVAAGFFVFIVWRIWLGICNRGKNG